MLDVMFDIPRSDEPRIVRITEDCITKGEQPKITPAEKQEKPKKQKKLSA
jgi:ATP-dependent Clp protease ATP-binding subunit ClpX